MKYSINERAVDGLVEIIIYWDNPKPIPAAEWSKARVCGLSRAGVVGSNPAGGMDVCVVFVVQ
jgi:hypothetical protein